MCFEGGVVEEGVERPYDFKASLLWLTSLKLPILSLIYKKTTKENREEVCLIYVHLTATVVRYEFTYQGHKFASSFKRQIMMK